MNDTVIASLINSLQASVKILQERVGVLESKLDALEKASNTYFKPLQPVKKPPVSCEDIFKVLKQDQDVTILKQQGFPND